jgi:hypothetical protein
MKLNIVYVGGTCGAFLSFFLNKFSILTPDIEQYPFNKNGTVHDLRLNEKFLICQHWHENFIQKNINRKNLNVCAIFLNENFSYLYYTISCMIRARNANNNPDFLWQKTKEECLSIKGTDIDMKNLIENHPPFKNHKDIKFSKKEIRDWYLQIWRQKIEDYSLYQQHKNFKNDIFFTKQKTFCFPFESFLYWDIFKNSINKLNEIYGLGLDFKKEQEMKKLFEESIKVDYCRQQVINVEEITKALKLKKNIEIKELNVMCEAYLISDIEKNYKISLPSEEIFFQNTKDLFKFIN